MEDKEFARLLREAKRFGKQLRKGRKDFVIGEWAGESWPEICEALGVYPEELTEWQEIELMDAIMGR